MINNHEELTFINIVYMYRTIINYAYISLWEFVEPIYRVMHIHKVNIHNQNQLLP